MRIAALQHDIVWEDAAATCDLLEPLIAAAADDGARLVVLTEMFGPGSRWPPTGSPNLPAAPLSSSW